VDPRADLDVLDTRKRGLPEVNCFPSWKFISAAREMSVVLAGKSILQSIKV
jgi:hypothetical protein